MAVVGKSKWTHRDIQLKECPKNIHFNTHIATFQGFTTKLNFNAAKVSSFKLMLSHIKNEIVLFVTTQLVLRI